MTGKSVAIIDSDCYYSRALSERLRRYLPDARISRYSPSVLAEHRDELSADIILYDNEEIRPEHFADITSASLVPIWIPLKEETDRGTRMNGKSISERIISMTDESESAGFTGPDMRSQSGILRLFLSLGSRGKREQYIRSNTGALMSSGHRLIRLDIMPGISISEPGGSLIKGRRDLIPTGLSDLLLRLNAQDLDPEILLDYLRPNGAGWLYFGRPARSDDMISGDPIALVRMVKMLRLLVDGAYPPVSAIVAVEGLPFSKVKQICPLAHEMHVIYPDDAADDDPMIRYELEQIFSASGPRQLKFISSSREAI